MTEIGFGFAILTAITLACICGAILLFIYRW
jgi:hypothetical protein